GELLQDGKNEIRIEVANLMANRMRDLDQRKVNWRNYHEINFVNIDYKAFDASQWKLMDSGLGGPVQLCAYYNRLYMFGKDHFEKNGLFIYRRFIAYAIE